MILEKIIVAHLPKKSPRLWSMKFHYVYNSPPPVIALFCVSTSCDKQKQMNVLGILLYLFLHTPQPQPLPSVNFQGHNLVVYDVQQEALDLLKEMGATVSHSPQDVAAQVDCVITMLPNTACVLEVYNGENGILK